MSRVWGNVNADQRAGVGGQETATATAPDMDAAACAARTASERRMLRGLVADMQARARAAGGLGGWGEECLLWCPNCCAPLRAAASLFDARSRPHTRRTMHTPRRVGGRRFGGGAPLGGEA